MRIHQNFFPLKKHGNGGLLFFCEIGNLIKMLVLIAAFFSFGVFASPSRYAVHGFYFHGGFDEWLEKVDLLEYSYGDKYQVVQGKIKPGMSTLGFNNVYGFIPVGDYLYVKWRIKQTMEVLEDKVDLRDRLPLNMEKHSVTFTLENNQLYVYLVTPIPKSENDPPLLRTSKSRYYVTYEIYPNNTYKNSTEK